MTRKMFHRGLSVLVVGRNGRGYMPNWWVDSRTFRLREQSNLLVHDNVTRAFDEMPFPEKQEFARRSWGHFLGGGGPVAVGTQASARRGGAASCSPAGWGRFRRPGHRG